MRGNVSVSCKSDVTSVDAARKIWTTKKSIYIRLVDDPYNAFLNMDSRTDQVESYEYIVGSSCSLVASSLCCTFEALSFALDQVR